MHVHLSCFMCLWAGGSMRQVPVVPADYLDIRPEDSPGIKKLKRLSALDSTQLENLPEDLRPGKK